MGRAIRALTQHQHRRMRLHDRLAGRRIGQRPEPEQRQDLSAALDLALHMRLAQLLGLDLEHLLHAVAGTAYRVSPRLRTRLAPPTARPAA
jgi:hypothetical protein